MNSHFRYLKYVIRHKWFVFRACLEFRRSPYFWRSLLWRSIIHDWQKFTPCEWGPYVKSFYGPWRYKDRPGWLVESFDRAWLHHQHYGPHHWQYWILREDNGTNKPLDMPTAYVMEMVADWSGAGMAINGNPDPHDWYFKNKEKIILHERTRRHVEYIIHGHLFGGTYDESLF